MLLSLALAAIMQPSAGPIDAFRANLASARVGADFDCKIWYNFNLANLKDVFNFESGAGPAGEPGYLIQGRWEYDGTCERYVIRVTGGSKFKPNAKSGPMPSVEVLCDDETIAFHYLKPGESSFRVHQFANKYPFPMVGPFTLRTMFRFDRNLKVNYASSPPVRSKGERGGHPTEVEVYQRTVGDIKVRDEIAYDPSLGYLPRYYRGIAYGMERGRNVAGVINYYLIDAKPCWAGGFVPTEWFLTDYELDDFESKYPGYDENTKLVAPGHSTVLHFKVNNLEDKKDQAHLANLAGVTTILAPGGVINSKAELRPMTMSEVRSMMGTKAVTSNQPALPKIDQVEKHEFDPPKSTNWKPYWLAGLSLVVIAAFLVYRRSGIIVVLIGLIPVAGCGQQQPVPRLTAAFAQSRVLYDATRPMLKLDLIISNSGNQTLKIMKVDAGCSCRQVTPGQLPAIVRPGEGTKVAVSLSGKNSYNPENFVFTFLTDQGQLTAPVTLLSIPKHRLSPDSITLSGLDESSPDEAVGFELTHREVYEAGRREQGAELVIPTGFVMEDRGMHEGKVAGSPDLAFGDTSYHFTIKDRSLGLHRADIILKGAGGRTPVQAPLVWQRLPFISSVPERINLTARPVRVFLRCRDDSVELTRVLSTPPGVKAELDSPRSIRVTMSDDAPTSLQDFVEVGATSVASRTLRVPVTRYAPLATQ